MSVGQTAASPAVRQRPLTLQQFAQEGSRPLVRKMIQLDEMSSPFPTPWVRPFAREDRDAVMHLLSFLPKLYPDGYNWLERRLDEVERRQAFCSVAGVDEILGGILIETSKGRRASKISTLYVGDFFPVLVSAHYCS